MAAQQIASVSSYKNPKLAGINEVEISKSGKYKYILIKVHDPDKDREFKFIVRGNSKCSYHGEFGKTDNSEACRLLVCGILYSLKYAHFLQLSLAYDEFSPFGTKIYICYYIIILLLYVNIKDVFLLF